MHSNEHQPLFSEIAVPAVHADGLCPVALVPPAPLSPAHQPTIMIIMPLFQFFQSGKIQSQSVRRYGKFQAAPPKLWWVDSPSFDWLFLDFFSCFFILKNNEMPRTCGANFFELKKMYSKQNWERDS